MNTRILIAAIAVTMFFLSEQVHAQEVGEPEQAEVTELEGTWEAVSCVLGGEQRDSGGLVWRFEGNKRYWRKNDDNGNWPSGEPFTLDSTPMPAEFEFHLYDWLGIYELDDDMLTVCYNLSGGRGLGARPDVFESLEGSSTMLIVLRRVTEEVDE